MSSPARKRRRSAEDSSDSSSEDGDLDRSAKASEAYGRLDPSESGNDDTAENFRMVTDNYLASALLDDTSCSNEGNAHAVASEVEASIDGETSVWLDGHWKYSVKDQLLINQSHLLHYDSSQPDGEEMRSNSSFADCQSEVSQEEISHGNEHSECFKEDAESDNCEGAGDSSLPEETHPERENISGIEDSDTEACDFIQAVHAATQVVTLATSQMNVSNETLLLEEDEDQTIDTSLNYDGLQEVSADGAFDDQYDSMEYDNNVINDENRNELLKQLKGIVTSNQVQYSTPTKQAPPIMSFSLLSPLKEDSDVSSSSSNSSEGSKSEDADNTFDWLDSMEEDCNSEAADNFEVFDQFETSDTLDETGTVSNESIDQASDYSVTLTKACLLNELKIHNHSELSVNEGIIQIMDLYLKNGQSKAGLSRAINTICNFLPEEHHLPKSSHNILNYIESLAPPVPATVHYYCHNCLFYHGTEIVGVCDVCGADMTFGRFFSFGVAALIKFFFESRNLASILESEERNECDPPGLRSLKDGSVYKELNRDKGKYDINIILNGDGVRIRKGAKELWLAMFTIVELPIHLQKSYLSVVGVWYDEHKPDMKTFLRPFAEEMESLDPCNNSGVTWTHPSTKQVHTSHVKLPVTVFDAPARAISQNVMHHNCRYGCNVCETKATLTVHVPGHKRLRRYHYVHAPTLRTKERMLEQAVRVSVEGKKHVKGVKGPSVLSIIPSVDVSKCFVPEYMHAVLIGTCKQLLVILTSKLGPWCLKDRISEIDGFLCTFKHPSFVHRSLRQLKSLKYWKASDFYYFLLFEALPCLKSHLPDMYFQHLTLLVLGIYKLLKTTVTEVDVSDADMLLRLFVIDFGRLYSDRNCTYSVHQLIHLGLCVRRYGPLHCWSAFVYEDLNGMVAKRTHGTNNVDIEIVRNIKICQGIHILKNLARGQHGLDVSSDPFQCELLGKEFCIQLPAHELLLLQDNAPKIFSRAKLGYDTFTSEMHKPLKSQNFYVMWTENELLKYGSIKYFARTQCGEFVFIRVLKVDHTQVFYHLESLKCVEHFIPVNTTQNYVAIKLADIVKCIAKVGKIGHYIYKRPNLYRYVL